MRKITEFGDMALNKNGVRMKDGLIIFPMQGRKKEIVLNRTCYKLKLESDYDLKIDGTDVSMPHFETIGPQFSLILCPTDKVKNEEDARFLIRADSDFPFRVNGIVSYEAFVERGDQVDVGYNRLKFAPEKSSKNIQQNEFPVNEKVVDSSLNVLLEGETGTGKSRMAGKIHQKSGRIGEFVHINLSSFSENLIESELFGHVKGAFTGAVNGKCGAFLEANRGTLFLDEIDSLPLGIQTKLLLFLDSKMIRPVGGGRFEKVDVRIIFASGKKLKQLVDDGKMREDFYYRIISGVVVRLPSLRSNPERTVELCHQFALNENVFIPEELINFYQKLDWPGNIRQLFGHLEKKKVMSAGRKFEFMNIDQELVDGEMPVGQLKSEAEFITMDELKTRYAYKVYQRLNQSMAKSCSILGISSNTMRSFVRKASG